MRKTQFVLQSEIKSFVEEAGQACCLFVTFTFSGDLDPSDASRRWNSLNTNVLKPLFGGKYIKVLEFTKRGRVHYHVLLRQEGIDFSTGFDWTAYRLAQKFRQHGNLAEARKWTKQYAASACQELRDLWHLMTTRGGRYGFGRIEALPIRESGLHAGYYLGKYVSKAVPAGHERVRHVTYGRGRSRVCNQNFQFITSAFRQKLTALAQAYPGLIAEKALAHGRNAWNFITGSGWDVQAKYHNLVHVKGQMTSDPETGGFFLHSAAEGKIRYVPNDYGEWVWDRGFMPGVPF